MIKSHNIRLGRIMLFLFLHFGRIPEADDLVIASKIHFGCLITNKSL